jgi:hypothetical protein
MSRSQPSVSGRFEPLTPARAVVPPPHLRAKDVGFSAPPQRG